MPGHTGRRAKWPFARWDEEMVFPSQIPPLYILMMSGARSARNLIQHYAVFLRVHVHVRGHGMATPPWRDVHV